MLLSECPVRAMIDVIDAKWKPIVIDALKVGKRGFGELHREVPEASKKVLIAQLRQLEADGIIARRSSDLSWERVEYSLTPYGKTLLSVLNRMATWGARHRKLLSYRSAL